MRPDRCVLMAEARAKKNLNKHYDSVKDRERVNRDSASIFKHFMRVCPPLARKNRQTQDCAKHNLGEARMQYWQPVVKQLDYDFPAQDRLRDDSAYCSQCKPTQPPPLLAEPDHNGLNNQQNSQDAGDYPMAVLVNNSADHRR